MHRAIATLALVLLSGCAVLRGPDTPKRVTVKGLVSFHEDKARLHECGTPREFKLGRMTPGQYLHLRQNVEKLARREGPVTAEFSGYVVKTGAKYVMEQPALLGLHHGRCVDLPDPGSWDY